MARLALGDLDNSPQPVGTGETQPVGTGEQAGDGADGPTTASIDALQRQLTWHLWRTVRLRLQRDQPQAKLLTAVA
jgi:hypothetical protein